MEWLDGYGKIAKARKEAGDEENVRKAFVPTREGLRDHGSRLRQDQRLAGQLLPQQKEFLNRPMDTCDQSNLVQVFEEILRASGSARLRLQGTSMLPAICPGDEVEIESCGSSECESGDVVAFCRDGRLFIHRVVESENGRLLTQGDALTVPDAPITGDEFLGKVTAVWRDGENVSTTPSLAQRAAAAVFRRSRTCASVFQKIASL